MIISINRKYLHEQRSGMSAEALGWVFAVGFAVLFVAAIALLARYLWRSQ